MSYTLRHLSGKRIAPQSNFAPRSLPLQSYKQLMLPDCL